MKTIVFFDDFLIHRQESVQRVVHTPVWIDESSYADPQSPYGMGYASVVPAPDGGYYLYYMSLVGGAATDERSTALCVARSDDALHWEAMPVGTDARGRDTNVLISGRPAPQTSGKTAPRS